MSSVLDCLRNHPAVKISSPDSVLPFAMDNPHPELTLALHILWGSLRHFISLSEGGEASWVVQDSVTSALKILETLRSPLVSYFFLFLGQMPDYHSSFRRTITTPWSRRISRRPRLAFERDYG